jgi:hypothetical protein
MLAVSAAIMSPGDRRFLQRDAFDKGRTSVWHVLDTH